MNAWLVAAALGLLAAWPLTVVGSLIGLLAERLTRAPRVREVAWGVVFVLPLLFLLQVLGGRFFADAFATAPAVAAHTARVHSTLPLSSIAPPAAPPLFEAWLARPEAVWVAVAVLTLSLMGAVARLAMWMAGRQRLAVVIVAQRRSMRLSSRTHWRGKRRRRGLRSRPSWSARRSTGRCSRACGVRRS
ncbi:MAG TPA: hypothetical protein VGL66_11725 [Caulobacteraceae bacterium]|jgi:hypothetical protein